MQLNSVCHKQCIAFLNSKISSLRITYEVRLIGVDIRELKIDEQRKLLLRLFRALLQLFGHCSLYFLLKLRVFIHLQQIV